MLKNLFYLFFIVFLLVEGCNKKPDIQNKDHSAVLNYLGSEKNYKNKKEYVLFFQKNYKNYIDKKEYRNAEETLLAYGNLANHMGGTDSIINKSIFRFIKNDNPLKKDTVHGKLYYLAGLTLMFDDKMKGANFYAKKAMQYSKEYPNSKIYLDSKNLVGDTYSYMGDYKTAIPILLEIVKVAEINNKNRLLGIVYNDLAYCYDSFYAHEEAEKYYVKAGQKLLLLKDTATYISIRTNYIMNNFNSEKDTVKTLNLITATDKIVKNYKDATELSNATLYDLSVLKYMLKKNYDSAAIINQRGSEFFTKINNYPIAENFKTIGEEIFLLKNGYLRNPNRAKKMADIAIKEDEQEVAINMYNLLYKDALNNKRYEEAIKYRNLEIKSNEILQKENAGGKLFEFDKKYQTEKNEKEIATQKIKIQKNNFYIIVLLLVLAVLTLLVILYLNKLKREKIINEKKKNEQFIFDLLENVEIERNRIAYELHDSVNHSLLNVKNLILSKKEIKSESISNIIEEVREISRNLYPVILEKVGLEESIKSLSENFSDETSLFVTTDISYKNKIEKSRELHIYRIIQEALNNTLKHGKASIAKIIMTEDGHFLSLSIKDNGEGFDVISQTNAKNSFGLQGLKQRAQAIKGNLDIQSNSSGTTVKIIMPI